MLAPKKIPARATIHFVGRDAISVSPAVLCVSHDTLYDPARHTAVNAFATSSDAEHVTVLNAFDKPPDAEHLPLSIA
jgi:hypothetical protein